MGKNLVSRSEIARPDELEHGLPGGAPLLGRALLHALHLALEGAKAEPEHVSGHLAADALTLEFVHQVRENLSGNECERCASMPGRCELGYQDGRLTNDELDQNVDGHGVECPPKPRALRLSAVPLGASKVREPLGSRRRQI